MRTREIRVVNLDTTLAEVGDIEESLAIDVGRSGAFIDCAIIRIVQDKLGALTAVPAGDRAVFGHEDKPGGAAGGKDKVRAAVEDRAGGRGGGASGSVLRRRNGDRASAINGDDRARAGVESR